MYFPTNFHWEIEMTNLSLYLEILVFKKTCFIFLMDYADMITFQTLVSKFESRFKTEYQWPNLSRK